MSDSPFQSTSNKNQFQNDYDGRKILSVDISKIKLLVSCIITYFSKRPFCMNKQLVRAISLDLANTNIQYMQISYDADNIDNNK